MTAFVVAAQAHVGDVHVIFAHQRSDVADDAGAVFVGHQKQHSCRHHFHRQAVDSHDARMALFAEERAARGHFLSL